MKSKSLIFLGVLLSGCSSLPDKATSIEDYCEHVKLSASEYAKYKFLGVDKIQVKLDITGQYRDLNQTHPHEVWKMVETIDDVYDGMSGEEIYKNCVVRRNNNTWFTRKYPQNKQ